MHSGAPFKYPNDKDIDGRGFDTQKIRILDLVVRW